MPRYVYKCRECKGSFVTVHGMTEDQDCCELCFKTACVYRIPQMPSIKITKDESGKLVKEYIQEARGDLESEKRRLKDQEYEPK